jgi:hypothetical protein
MARVVRKPGPGAEKLRVALEALDGKVGKVGWFETAKYPDGTRAAYVAAIHEYGYKSIPPRLGMRETADAKRKEWAGVAKQGAKEILAGRATAGTVMEMIGLAAFGDMYKRISTVQSPPLSQVTIELRRQRRANPEMKVTGRSVGEAVKASQSAFFTPGDTSAPENKPLVDTGYLLVTLTHVVEDS